ncbi:PTS sugar transporter subunit IIB [Paenibacillus sp. PK4536]|jgi:PTS system ascorbate-specific IIB component|uniref:Protein-N(Pi)-phosphohistidine--sugar phosphotransferase n=3 Tax=Paenibacillus TaxID=44249 RepID=A0A1E3L7D6_9BACL|nr:MULTISPECIES: PTS sugar transporter subunit IIB [Paenibacillus]MDN4618562.1 PTS sugar transporter subunit IIB [Paenibacillus sp. PsM32]MDQ1236421.1 PTS system ascorbate-specific IIB component [Paenibacillus sp. SORGH_AS_0306]MDR6108774.1 PTS system ascorbate-specific IIB component [Paenibacillus sp. SORGH_AS_0338]ODP29564.1 Protein-N(pi)-phosphohistidine--sugar phosphotransferase [Paenibacillus nuruki]TKJ88854.1 PTS lactose transporter subunit IIB [Paenibacillus sp. CFBP13512]
MKIMVVCGNGLGSSFIMEINIKKALTEMGKVADVDHTDLSSAKSEQADIFIGAADIMAQLSDGGRTVVSLENMMSIPEIKSKLEPLLA